MRTAWCTIALAACGAPVEAPVDTDSDVVPLEAPPEGQGFQVEMSAHAEPFTEVWACAVYTAPNTSTANVNWVQYQQNAGTHHMTLSTAFDAASIPFDDGLYDCDEVYQGDFMKDQVMFFGNQGAATGELHLPEGIAAQLPGGLKIVHEVHYVNASESPVDLYSRVNAWTIPDADVTSGIWGGSVRDEHIEIPANAAEHVEWSRCVMNRDVDVLFLASHMHARGVEFTIAPFDGETVGETLFTNTDWHDPKITQFDPPLTVKAGQGFQFTCTWRNDDDHPVSYGLTAEDEMCNMAIVHTPFDLGALCEVVETSDGVLYTP
jgi:hypothetical protein